MCVVYFILKNEEFINQICTNSFCIWYDTIVESNPRAFDEINCFKRHERFFNDDTNVKHLNFSKGFACFLVTNH